MKTRKLRAGTAYLCFAAFQPYCLWLSSPLSSGPSRTVKTGKARLVNWSQVPCQPPWQCPQPQHTISSLLWSCRPHLAHVCPCVPMCPKTLMTETWDIDSPTGESWTPSPAGEQWIPILKQCGCIWKGFYSATVYSVCCSSAYFNGYHFIQ